MRAQVLRLLSLIAFASLLVSACAPAAPQPTPTPGSGGSAPDVPAASGGSGDPGTGATVDTSTGLTAPPLAPIPSGVSAPAPDTNLAHGSAMLVINGDLPIIYSGGDCDVYEEEMYLSIYPGTLPGASFILLAGSGSTRAATMVWARSGLPEDNAAVSATDPLVVTLNADGFSGSFEGRGFRVGGAGEPVAVPISISGSFTCISQLVRVGGDHPVDMTGVSCEASPTFILRAGGPSGNAVLLETEAGARAGSTVVGGISWRVGGIAYTSNWLSVQINADGVSGSYFGEGTNADGSTFRIQGSFNCLGA